MNRQPLVFALAALLIVSVADADDSISSNQRFSLTDLQWYGGLHTSYLKANGEVSFYGNAATIYGGTPAIGMDDGGAVSLTLGTDIGNGWRLQGDFGYLNMRTDTSPVLGFDDRSDDLFSMDAEVESLLLMLNGAYDFDIGGPRLTPFVTGGIGLARNKSTQTSLDVEFNSALWNGSIYEGATLDDYQYPKGRATEFAWNVGAGLRFDLSDHFAMVLEYGFLDLGEALTETDENGDALGWNDLTTERLTLGVDYRF